MARPWLVRAATVAVALVVAAAAASFFVATTFISDDHLFLTFARLVPNPLVAFVRDQHGGEFYRPLPMTLWWLLAHAGGFTAFPFAATALALHALVSVQAGVLAGAAGEGRAVRILTGLLFFLVPQNLEAAYWFSASTDQLATAASLGALIVVTRSRRPAAWLLSLVLAACALCSKESALASPLLALALFTGRRRANLLALPFAVLAAALVAIRWKVLHGWGGTSDQAATFTGKLLQLGSGLVHLGTGEAVLPEPLAWGLGCVALACLARHVARHRRDASEPAAWRPAALVGVSLLPLLGADWAVGARYFYLPAVGVCWLAARCLTAAPLTVRALVLSAVIGCSALQAAQRHANVVDYDARVNAARQAIVAGLADGHSVLHLASGVKDLDLALKRFSDVRQAEGPHPRLLVLTDVPASFVLLPPALTDRAALLLATPPIPPSGAYHFGADRVVGLARRHDDPELADVVRQFPDIRFLRLSSSPDGVPVVRDVTDAVLSGLKPP